MSGVERIARAFAQCTAEDRGALIPFITAGDPDFATTVAVARAAAENGADIIEVGLPFSDSVADGPVIQASYTRALAGGATTSGAIAACADIARATRTPVVAMVALNVVLARGVERFCADLSGAGVSGLLVPDLLADDAPLVADEARRHGLGMVFLAGPSTGTDRLTVIADASTAFIYVVRRGGVTGAGGDAGDLAERIAALRARTDRPLAVGFGISTPSDVSAISDVADGAIVGSALVDAAHHAGSRAAGVIGKMVRELASGARHLSGRADAKERAYSVKA